MKLSIPGMMAILQDEAISLSTYPDSGKVDTIGAGHTARAGGLVPKRGMKLSLDDCLRLFLRDVEIFDRRVAKAISVPLLAHEHDALVRFDLNCGKIIEGSIDDKLNRGDREAAMDTLESYKKDNGKTLKGLVARRASERRQFVAGSYPPPTPIKVYEAYPKGLVLHDYSDIKAALLRLVNEKHIVSRDTPPPKVARPPAQSGAGGAEVGGAIIVGGGALATGTVVVTQGVSHVNWWSVAVIVLLGFVIAGLGLALRQKLSSKKGNNDAA